MNIQLIQGEFESKDALELIVQMVHIKIKYHENKIQSDSNEEDIKTRERKIIRLQQELFEVRKALQSNTNSVKLESIINII
jgi:hypothetical protein